MTANSGTLHQACMHAKHIRMSRARGLETAQGIICLLGPLAHRMWPGAMWVLQSRRNCMIGVAGQWAGMRQRAWMLLLVGIVVGVACTKATLTAVHQEAEVVQLAQEIAASEVQV